MFILHNNVQNDMVMYLEMKKEEREKKVRFVEILLTVGSLLGTALTLSGMAQQTGTLFFVSLPVFILSSIFYYYLISYELSNRYKVKLIPSTSFVIALSFAVLFANIIAIPATSTSLLSIFIILSYFAIMVYVIYNILMKGLSMEIKKEDKVNQKEQIERNNDSDFKLSMGIAILGIGLSAALFGFDKLDFKIDRIILWAYALMGLGFTIIGAKMMGDSQKDK